MVFAFLKQRFLLNLGTKDQRKLQNIPVNGTGGIKKKTFAFKIEAVIVLTAASFKHASLPVNQYVDNESNQPVMGMTFWTRKEVSVLVRGNALAIDLCTLAPR